MPDNVIDELKIVLTLDPSKYTEAQKKILRSFHDTKEEASETAAVLERKGAQGGAFFDQIATSALKLGSVLLGGVGLKDFIANTISFGSASGYMAQNIGIGVKELGLWQTAIQTVGGEASSVGPALLGLSQALTTLELHGKGSADIISAFQFLGIKNTIDETTGKFKTVAQLLPEIHKGLAALDAQKAYNVGTSLGLNADMINLLRQPDSIYGPLLAASQKVGTETEKQAATFQRLIADWGLFKGALRSTGYELTESVVDILDQTSTEIDKVTKSLHAFEKQHSSTAAIIKSLTGKYTASDIGATVGGLVGGVLGSAAGPAGTVAGATVGVVIGGTIGAAIAKTSDAIPPRIADASTTGSTPSFLSSYRQTTGAPIAKTSDDQSQFMFEVIQKLEGAKDSSVTATGLPQDPYAYGRNQITLETARRYDQSATAQKLLDASYNETLARKIQSDYAKRYNNNPDAIAIAYHNGPGAADRFIASGGSTAGLGPQSLSYLQQERSLVAAAGNTNNSSNTTHIGAINVNAPSATDANGVAASIRRELAENQLISQGNAGPQ